MPLAAMPIQTDLLRVRSAAMDPLAPVRNELLPETFGFQGVVFSIDPGPQQSGYVIWDNIRSCVIGCGVWSNVQILKLQHEAWHVDGVRSLAIEMVESFGMAVGKEVFETVRWVGRFQQAWPEPEAVRLVYRKEVKRLLCGSLRATSANIRQALIDRYGSGEAIGNKKTPGPLYSVKSHAWSALAVAITACETR